jgi:7-keto-8-aminopelargonate synthetase-like enzyme
MKKFQKFRRQTYQTIAKNFFGQLSQSDNKIDFSSNDYLGYAEQSELFVATHLF